MNARKSFGSAWARLVSNQRPLACEASAVGKQEQLAANRISRPTLDQAAPGLSRLAGSLRESPGMVERVFGECSARRGVRFSTATPRRGK